MGDNDSAGLFQDLFEYLASNLKTKQTADQFIRKLGKWLRSKTNSYDFNDDDMCCYKALYALDLAYKCKHCGQFYTDWNEDEHTECTTEY